MTFEDRMPWPIGEFISKASYDDKLKTDHPITSKTCCQFIDVDGDETKDGHSWKVSVLLCVAQ